MFQRDGEQLLPLLVCQRQTIGSLQEKYLGISDRSAVFYATDRYDVNNGTALEKMVRQIEQVC